MVRIETRSSSLDWTTARGSPTVDQLGAELVDVDRLLGAVLQQLPTGELEAVLHTLGRDAADGDDDRAGSEGEPQAAASHQVGTVGVEPVGHAAPGGQAEQLRRSSRAACELTTHSMMTRTTTRAENIETRTPRPSVIPKPADGPGRGREQQPGGDEGGDVRVDDGAERLLEPGPGGGPDGLAERAFLLGAFEHQDVRVDRHADGQHEPGDARQGQHRAEPTQASRRPAARRPAAPNPAMRPSSR